MTNDETISVSDSTSTESRRLRRTTFGEVIADRAQQLQAGSGHDDPSSVRTLAVLRRAAGLPPGAVSGAWADTLGLTPPGCFDPSIDEPSAAELAAHHAMTLFAIHRQGKVGQAHRDGVTPGRAFATLSRKRSADGSADNEGVRRRFDAMMTASSVEESARHLRGIVQMMRAEDVAIDYGQLAEDLADLWSVPYQDQARLRWARQYRGLRPSADISAFETQPTTSATVERSSEESA